MKSKSVALIFVVALSWVGVPLYADSDSNGGHAYIGVLLDTTPLPDLLIKHLGLSPDQGVRIRNVNRGSPADEVGLERDDIIIGFQGKDVNNSEYGKFVDQVRGAGVGTEVSLEIVHLGKRKTLKFKLEAFKDGSDLKYPPEPEIVQSWRPGKIFRLRPGDESWTEILRDDMPSEFRVNINRIFKDLYTSQHSVDGEDYTITIEGDPDDEDTLITVRMGDTEYKTTLNEIDELPEKYREAADQALKKARKSAKSRWWTPGAFELYRQAPKGSGDYFELLTPHSQPPAPRFGPGDEMFDKIQKQMRELQKRVEELEKHQSQTPNSDEQEPKEQQKEAGQ